VVVRDGVVDDRYVGAALGGGRELVHERLVRELIDCAAEALVGPSACPMNADRPTRADAFGAAIASRQEQSFARVPGLSRGDSLVVSLAA
jgi:hypothetical protein